MFANLNNSSERLLFPKWSNRLDSINFCWFMHCNISVAWSSDMYTRKICCRTSFHTNNLPNRLENVLTFNPLPDSENQPNRSRVWSLIIGYNARQCNIPLVLLLFIKQLKRSEKDFSDIISESLSFNNFLYENKLTEGYDCPTCLEQSLAGLVHSPYSKIIIDRWRKKLISPSSELKSKQAFLKKRTILLFEFAVFRAMSCLIQAHSSTSPTTCSIWLASWTFQI